jgi:ribonuclease HI
VLQRIEADITQKEKEINITNSSSCPQSSSNPILGFKARRRRTLQCTPLYIDNKPIEDRKSQQEILATEWRKIFEQDRHSDPHSLASLLAQYPHRCSDDPFDLSNDDFLHTLQRKKASCAGPDGIPFSFLTANRSRLAPLLLRMAMKMTCAGTSLPPQVSNARLILIPKKCPRPSPLDFRPLSITNTIYRVITKTLSHKFRKTLSNVLSPHQRAILEGRRIDDAVRNIAGAYYDRSHHNLPTTLLQTDFSKAFDFINQGAIISILRHMNVSPQMVNFAECILQPYSLALGNNESMVSRCGVKQGCCLAPLLFIAVADILLHPLSRIPTVIHADGFADDIGIIVSSPSQLEHLSSTFSTYCSAVGAQLNYQKCTIISNQAEPGNPPPPWNLGSIAESTKYLGFPISNNPNFPFWQPITDKLSKVCHEIASFPSNLKTRITLWNTFASPTTEYCSRFRIMDLPAAMKISSALSTALGPWKYVKRQCLITSNPIWGLSNRIRWPPLTNIALLARQCPPSQLPLSPLSPSSSSNIANNIITSLTNSSFTKAYHQQSHSPTRTLHTILSTYIPPCPFIHLWNTPTPHPQYALNYQIISFNLQHCTNSLIRDTAILLFNQAWHLPHQIHRYNKNTPNLCNICQEHSTYHHTLFHCKPLIEIINNLQHYKIKPEMWPEYNSDLLLSKRPLTKQETIVRLIIIRIIFISTKTHNHTYNYLKLQAEKEWKRMYFKFVSKKKSHKPNKEPVLKAPPKIPDSLVSACFDGSGRFDLPVGGAGSVLYVRGKEVRARASTIPFGTNNICEFFSMIDAMSISLSEGFTRCHIYGDSEIAIEAVTKKLPPKDPLLLILYIRALALMDAGSFSFEHIPRQYNKRADAIANAAGWSIVEGVITANNPGLTLRTRTHPSISIERIFALPDPFSLPKPTPFNLLSPFSHTGRTLITQPVVDGLPWGIYPKPYNIPQSLTSNLMVHNILSFTSPHNPFLSPQTSSLTGHTTLNLTRRKCPLCKLHKPQHHFEEGLKECKDCWEFLLEDR